MCSYSVLGSVHEFTSLLFLLKPCQNLFDWTARHSRLLLDDLLRRVEGNTTRDQIKEPRSDDARGVRRTANEKGESVMCVRTRYGCSGIMPTS